MNRTPSRRPLTIDPAALRHAPRERLAMRWFARTGRDGTPTLTARWTTVGDPSATGRLAA